MTAADRNADRISGADGEKNKVECGKAAGYIKMVGKKMYRVSKVLNNNGIIAINMEENQETEIDTI